MDYQGKPRPRRRFAARALGRERQAKLKHVYLLPNLFTTGAMFFGTLAIVRIFQGRPETACWLILSAGVLDVFDGMIARLTHTESQFGLHYDSLSDVVTFGVAPAALMIHFLSGGDPNLIHPTISGPAILYAICGALRLARFNVQAHGEESKYFTGLPIPGAAATAIAAYLVFKDYDGWALHLMPVLMVALGFLMVSKVPYPSLKSIRLKNRTPFEFLVIIVLVVVIINLIDSLPLTLLGGAFIYIIYGLIRWFRIVRRSEVTIPISPSTQDGSQSENEENML